MQKNESFAEASRVDKADKGESEGPVKGPRGRKKKAVNKASQVLRAGRARRAGRGGSV